MKRLILILTVLLLGVPAPTVGAQASASSGTVTAPSPPDYVALVNLLAAAEPADKSSKDRVIDPEKAVLLFRASDVVGGNAFTCGVTPPPSPKTTPSPGIKDIAAILECATNPDRPIATRLGAIDHLVMLTKGTALRRASRYPRAITDRADTIRIAVLHEAVATRAKSDKTPYIIRTATAAIEIKETARTSRIATDLQTLAKVAAKIATGARAATLPVEPNDTESASVTWISEREYVLTLSRATLAVSATLSGSPTAVAATAFDDEALKVFLQKEQDSRLLQTAEKALEAQKKATELVAKGASQIDCSTPLTLASPPLIRLSCTLQDRSVPREARIAAAEGLAVLEQPLAHGPLATVASNPSEPPEVRAAAVAALAKIKLPGTTVTGVVSAPPAPEGSLKTAMSLNTGPAERWYLSADVPLAKDSKISTDASGNVTGVTDPGAFYIGAGVQFGDLLTRHRNPLLNLSLKLLVKASSRPLDSFGAALALRGQYLSKFGIDFDVVSPFVAALSTREVPPDSQQLPVTDKRKTAIVGGLSLNLNAALGWLK